MFHIGCQVSMVLLHVIPLCFPMLPVLCFSVGHRSRITETCRFSIPRRLFTLGILQLACRLVRRVLVGFEEDCTQAWRLVHAHCRVMLEGSTQLTVPCFDQSRIRYSSCTKAECLQARKHFSTGIPLSSGKVHVLWFCFFLVMGSWHRRSSSYCID